MSILTRRTIDAPAPLVHDLLTDIAAWRAWSPHIAHVEPPVGHLRAGQDVCVRPWFGPANTMHVDTASDGAGMTWSTTAVGHTLRYRQEITPLDDGRCDVVFTAEVDGPAGALVTRVASPLSALGQRRRLERLAALAELIHARA